MPIMVVATGRLREGPTRLLGEDSWVVFVLDPFPGSTGSRLAHACEVVCRRQDLATSVLKDAQRGHRVEVTGELVKERIDGPIEDDLSAVRMWIKSSGISVTQGTSPR
jgi:hypothetical protein